jgi:hypothetical protein
MIRPGGELLTGTGDILGIFTFNRQHTKCQWCISVERNRGNHGDGTCCFLCWYESEMLGKNTRLLLVRNDTNPLLTL